MNRKNSKPSRSRNRFESSSRQKNSSNRGKSSNRRRGGNRSGGKIKKLKLEPESFIHKGVAVEDVAYQHTYAYKDFPLHPGLSANLKRLGYENPTEIQEKAFRSIMEIKDVLAIANTGTGKTAAFLIPLINSMLLSDNRFSCLVMVPTRELAQQVEAEFNAISKKLGLYGISFIGGTSVQSDVRALKRRFDFVIGTPGRIMDLAKRKALDFKSFSVLVIDEFDRMLDMGFSQDMIEINSRLTEKDQTLLFSATKLAGQQKLIDQIMNDPVEFHVSSGKATAEHINQDVVFFNRKNKFNKLLDLVNQDDFEKVLIFSETKRSVSEITKKLKTKKFRADEIHGDKSQNYRKNALRNFKRGKTNILVATDVAARGLDISDVTHVINYQIPQDYETYIHRIGRTGRAGKEGQAFTFYEEKRG